MKDMDKIDFFKFEREGLDFPFYRNNPKLNVGKWVLLAISVIMPMILIFSPHTFGGRLGNLSYFLIPFVIFGILTSWNYNLICKKFQKNDIKLIIILLVTDFLFTFAIAIILTLGLHLNIHANPAIGELNSLLFWIIYPFQIFGEELIKIIPFLIFLSLFYKFTKKRKLSIVISTGIVLLIFGLLHFPTYHNIISILLLQGLGSIFIMFAYIKTKNIFVSFVIHVLYDLITFSAAITQSIH
ncbi:hypothetical protein MBCUT_09580 [Methanobrevibacter cuticularis]|uniref:CAAX prenyl protease 2/Lysostaphin resistance protein A-like domain-containing protein n=1 Tax=Methanobrevibacter cuticularis TaxID=47311 RepID=A0A166E4T3_9EURY|nr:CPBP family intramembrane glutamic endopeptidase [Methanobrevibacter cuticularis]KZX16280.1 hypothetical protein MBCUT_09580 [Methanobrevibacter cuticularis]